MMLHLKKSSNDDIDQCCMVCEFLKRNREETPSVPFCDTQNSLETLCLYLLFTSEIPPPHMSARIMALQILRLQELTS